MDILVSRILYMSCQAGPGIEPGPSALKVSALPIELTWQNGSNVYSCLLDASKAFDCIHFGKLFAILIERNVPLCFIRLILDAYTRQQSRVSWNNWFSKYFSVSNGVKQGGVISPILFSIYIDKLLLKLKESGYGCHLNGIYIWERLLMQMT